MGTIVRHTPGTVHGALWITVMGMRFPLHGNTTANVMVSDGIDEAGVMTNFESRQQPQCEETCTDRVHLTRIRLIRRHLKSQLAEWSYC